jgi:large subunit ribosomal protein L21
VLGTYTDKKVVVFHFRAKKDSSDKKGHRQRFTRVKIDKIEA